MVFTPRFCAQHLVHFPSESHGFCGSIEGGDTELFFTKQGEAEALNQLAKSNEHKEPVLSPTSINVSVFPGINTLCPFWHKCDLWLLSSGVNLFLLLMTVMSYLVPMYSCEWQTVFEV